MLIKRTIPRAIFEPIIGLQASDLTGNEILLNLIKNETPLAIEEAFKAKKTFATILKQKHDGERTD